MIEEPVRNISVARVFVFVWRYWRRSPLMFTTIVSGVLISVLLEVLIPSISAELVLAAQEFLRDKTAAAEAWAAVWVLLGIFALRSLVQHLYLRVWMYFASSTMYRMVVDAFARVQRFSMEWHTNNFSGSTQRKITRGMWAYDQFADTVVIDLGPAFVLLIGFSVAMYLREPMLALYLSGEHSFLM